MPVFTERCGEPIDLARKSASLRGHRTQVFPISQALLLVNIKDKNCSTAAWNWLCSSACTSILPRPRPAHFIGCFKSHDARAAVSLRTTAAMPSSLHGYGQLPAAAENHRRANSLSMNQKKIATKSTRSHCLSQKKVQQSSEHKFWYDNITYGEA